MVDINENLCCRLIEFNVYIDKSKTDMIFHICIDSLNKSNLSIIYVLNSSVQMIKLYNRLRNDILLNTIDQDELFELIQSIENINYIYYTSLKNEYNENNKNHIYEFYKVIVNLLKKFCSVACTYCTVNFIGLDDNNKITNIFDMQLNEC